MNSNRKAWPILLIFLVFVLILAACSTTENSPDGDTASDGDVQTDHDQDAIDGDAVDGDTSPDGDRDADATPVDGDADEDFGCLDGDLDTDSTVDGDTTEQELPPVDGDLSADQEQNEGDGDTPADGDLDADLPDGEALSCPEDMALINRSFCMDRYEASRPDATAEQMGADTSRAVSLAGVKPWQEYPLSKQTARDACLSAGKRLCQPAEWVRVCTNGTDRDYVYGEAFSPDTCNSIDAFCDCEAAACGELAVCPYPHCRATCGADYHVMPTGSFSNCLSENGIFDINGNVWELVDSDDTDNHFRGGAFNCGNSEALHRCDYDATWGPSAQGFRCCKTPE